MALVHSLGIHKAAGLAWAVQEEVLPPSPPAASYRWDVKTDRIGDDEVEDELLTTDTCVIWSRGGTFRKSFKFTLENETVTQALLTYFPASEDRQESNNSSAPSRNSSYETRQPLAKALVVFLKTQVHIYFLSGTSHIVHMPFEVESACAAPCGVLIQRKSKVQTLAPTSLKFPRVPANSFISSQLLPSSQLSQGLAFSTERLGNPKTLPLRLSSTLDNMWQPPIESHESHWPRLVSLTDPLNELGLVVTTPEKVVGKKKSSKQSPFLDPAEEILHIESLTLPDQARSTAFPELVLAVSANREANTYSIWRLSYIENEDLFTGKKKALSAAASRRRSSMPPGAANAAQTPLQPNFRESFGAPMPGKKPRKSEKAPEKSLDKALDSLDPEKGGNGERRQSRRVSSLLARADLSASQDRATFSEQTLVPGHATGRRAESYGSQRGRNSGGHAGLSFSGTFNHNLNSVSEAPVDNLLDELRAGGDFEGFLSMGLEDHDFEGLTHEILLTKIHTFPMDNANVRFSLSNQPANAQSKVFVLVGPASASDEQGKMPLIVGIQDRVDQRLQLLTFTVERKPKAVQTPRAKSKPAPKNTEELTVSFGQLTRAQSVADSCKIVDGDRAMILILSEDKAGQRELSLQAPWSPMTIINLPLLFTENIDSLGYEGKHSIDRDVRGRRSLGVGTTNVHIVSLCHPMSKGVLDIEDKNGNHHRVRIQLWPVDTRVRSILETVQSVLPVSQGELIVTGWWHVMQWCQQAQLKTDNLEWSALTVLLFSLFLALGNGNESSAGFPSGLPGGSMPSQLGASSAPAFPRWMRNKGWQWLLDDESHQVSSVGEKAASAPEASFISRHVRLAKEYLVSSFGLASLGEEGYLPTAVGFNQESRRRSGWGIAVALHLLAEEQKLNIASSDDLAPAPGDLRAILYQIFHWLRWPDYEALYELSAQGELPQYENLTNIQSILPAPASVYSVFDWIQAKFAAQSRDTTQYLTLEEVCHVAHNDAAPTAARKHAWGVATPRTTMFAKLFQTLGPTSSFVETVEALYRCGFTPRVLESLPEAVLTPLQDAISMCQSKPPPSWSSGLLALVNRTDISMVLQPIKPTQRASADVSNPRHQASWDYRTLCLTLDECNNIGYDEGDGTERQAVVRALFKDDRRLNEAQNLLSPHKQRIVRLSANPAWSESEYLEKQKELVNTVATGTLSIPSGRGLLYYALRYPLLTQKFHIGGFNLTCVVKPTNVTVGVDKTLFTEEKIHWAFFHQGVAAGLAISPQAKGIDTSWILYNKPGQELSNRHAGFLLALGLNGHLKSVAKWVAFKYLTPKHTMTSIGLLLGLAASYMGTMDSLITRLLSVHVTRMLPRGSAELNLSRLTQTTGIMGLGILYCNSQHRRMSEIMLSEIEHVDDEEDEDPLRDEGYRLAAGYALGFINLGKGADLKGLRDMRLTEKLLTLATATKKIELVHLLDRSAAAAVMAIAIIFMKSEDTVVARKVNVPDTILQFDYIRPDVLLLRTVAKNLILWSEIEPTFDFVHDNLPKEYQWRHRLTGVGKLQTKDLPFFSILAGVCFAIALRFAGSGNPTVRDLLVHYLDNFIRIASLPSGTFDAEMARSNARMCMDLLALSAATVMAGTGDLVVLRRLRLLHGRDDVSTTYGSHLAAHTAVGIVFLGCGTTTFGTSDIAIAALLVAFYPIFPATVQDNRAHLQAFRHFWVLATEPRCLVVKDVATGQPIAVPVHIYLKPEASFVVGTKPISGDPEQNFIRRQTPCLLPPLQDVARVRTDAGALGYWDLEIDFARNPEMTDKFRTNQSLYLRRRPAHEGAFSATLRALGSRDGTMPDAAGDVVAASGGGAEPPLEWIFNLPALRGLTHADRALILDRLGSGGGVGEGEAASTVVDARLVLEAGLDGWSRDRLVGLRLLFEWADRRGLLKAGLLGDRAAAAEVKAAGRKEAKKTPAEVKGKGKGKKKVEVAEQPRDNDADAAEEGLASTAEILQRNHETGWWMSESVVEMLKGRAWLAGRE